MIHSLINLRFEPEKRYASGIVRLALKASHRSLDQRFRSSLRGGKRLCRLGPIPRRHGLAVELRHLRYFVAVVEEGSLTTAADLRLHTSQPSLSRQIRALEQQVGAES